MDLFKVIPDSFFSILASKNKRIYSTLLLEAYRIFQLGSLTGIEKRLVADELVHYLEQNDEISKSYDQEDLEDDEANPKSQRDLVNYFLRKIEEAGWITVDVSNDYVEVLNFTDPAITMCEALIELAASDNEISFSTEEKTEAFETIRYHGYIYTIYALLTNPDNLEYDLIMSEVLRNTKLLLAAIRKLDSQLKNYLSSIIDKTDVKDLIETLMNFRQDVVENGYIKLKMGDNINRYRLKIITKLEEYQNTEEIMTKISKNYSPSEDAYQKANRDIDETIDTFNSLDEYISEIDEKSKNYVNSTIAKIKFLLSEDDNIIGKLNRILKYVRDEVKINKVDRAMKKLNEGVKLEAKRSLNESSFYVPRGGYKRNFNLLLDDTRLADFDISGDFLDQYKVPYQEDSMLDFIKANMFNNVFMASEIIRRLDLPGLGMMLIYSILCAIENDELFTIEVLNARLVTKSFTMKDFKITMRSDDNA